MARKHTIKRVDRLLGNPHLHQERPLFYWLAASLLIGHMTRQLILVDWSPIDDRGQKFLLRAAVPFAGRSLPIFEKVHHKDGCSCCEAYLLAALAEILPDGPTPTWSPMPAFGIHGFRQARRAAGTTSVGFVARFAASCQGMSGSLWQTCFRKRHRCDVPWVPSRSLEANPLTTRMVLYHRPPQGRKHHNKRGQVFQDSRSRGMAQRQKEPWVLVSNLPSRSTLANKLVTIYRQRMQIEEGFSDIKSPLFGPGFCMHQSRKASASRFCC